MSKSPPLQPTGQRLSVSLVVMLFVVALAGRFSLTRVTTHVTVTDDLRWITCSALAVATFFWRFRAGHRVGQNRWPAAMSLAVVLVAYQLFSAFWSPMGARTGQSLGNLLALLVLIVCATMITRPDPARAARVLLVCAFAAAAVYAAGAFVGGAGIQGRYSAFGGGPNVFVRVECVGVIGAIALAAVARRYIVLLPIPLFLVAAMLSGSRGGLVALAGAMMAFAAFFHRRFGLRKLGGILVGIAVLGVLAWKLVAPTGIEQIQSRYSLSSLQSDDYSVRPRLLIETVSIFQQHPVVGGGLDSFYAYVGQFVGLGYPHNYVASLAGEGGVIALILLTAVVVRLWRDGRPWDRRTPEILGCAVAAIYIAMASMFSGDYFDTRFIWIFAAVLANSAAATTEAPLRAQRSGRSVGPDRFVQRPARGVREPSQHRAAVEDVAVHRVVVGHEERTG